MAGLRRRFLLTLALLVVTALAITTVSSSPVEAARPIPGPLCGFTAAWICTLPSGNLVKRIGTQCDVANFERRTGATCEIAGGWR